MSYVSTRGDIKEAFDEFYKSSEKLEDTIDDATYNMNLSEDDITNMLCILSKLKASRLEALKKITKLMKGKYETKE